MIVYTILKRSFHKCNMKDATAYKCPTPDVVSETILTNGSFSYESNIGEKLAVMRAANNRPDRFVVSILKDR